MTDHLGALSDDDLRKHEEALKARVPQPPALAPRDIMTALEQVSAEWHTRAPFTGLNDAQLRRLQRENPPINNDASNPMNDFPNAIVAEGKRRKLW